MKREFWDGMGTIMPLLNPIQQESSAPKAIFADKYDWLLRWALHFAGGNQADAEDLVQDTFVRFVVSESDIEDPEHAEPLLYTYLKSVHLSHIRRARRYPVQNISLVDFDSIDLAIRETASIDPIKVQDMLRQIVAYLLWRKERAKSASILLLRFFHGYGKAEIMRIGLLSDGVVANGLMLAREEIKKHLAGAHDPKYAAFQTAAPLLFPRHIAVPHEELLKELGQSIFEARQCDCLPREELLSRYDRLDSKPVECRLLAHIVSCQRCLDLVGRRHDIAPLSGRSPENGAGSGRRTKFGLRTRDKGESGPHRVLRSAERRLLELYEHQPRQLRVAVNGRIVASRDVSSPTNSLEIELSRETRIEFIEVYSEQHSCLLAMPIRSVPPQAPPELRRRAELMYGRSVEIVLRFTGVGALLEISYCDPSLPLSAPVAEELAEPEADMIPDEEHSHASLAEVFAPAGSSLLERLRQMGRLRFPFMNSMLASALVLGVASLICLGLWMKQQPMKITPDTLLLRAEAWDVANTGSAPGGVVRQRVRVKIARKTFNHTLYRDARRLRVAKPPMLVLDEKQWTAKLVAGHIRWDDPLSATTYRSWRDSQPDRRDEVARTGRNLLTLRTTVSQGDVAEETLTVRESDFHPVERSIAFRDSGAIEIAEIDYDVLPWQHASEAWFAPLAGDPSGNIAHPLSLPHLPHLLSGTEYDEAELSARVALNLIGADSGERIAVLRIPAGIQIKGIVATDVRKREIESKLRSIPHVIPTIFTFQDLDSGHAAGEPETSVKSSSAIAELTPLEQSLLAEGMSREDVGQFADRFFDFSTSLNQGSKAIEALLDRFDSRRNLSDASRTALTQLLRAYKQKILTTLQAEEQTVRQTGLPAPPPTTAMDTDTNAGMREIADRNIVLCRELVGNGVSQPRPAPQILAELLASAAQLRAKVKTIDADPLGTSTEKRSDY